MSIFTDLSGVKVILATTVCLVKVKCGKGKSLKGPVRLIPFQDVLWNHQEAPSHSHFLQDKLAASQPVGIIHV